MAVPSKNSKMLSLDAQRLRFMSRWLIALCLYWLTASAQATTITNLTEQAFTNALNTGGTIKFTVSGVLNLTSTKIITNNIVIDCEGQNVVFSGGNSNRLFVVMQGGELTAKYLTLSNGFVAGANGNNGADAGSFNVASPGSVGSIGQAGAIFNSNASVTLNYCTIISNKVMGGQGGKGGSAYPGKPAREGGAGAKAYGGAIYNLNGTVTLNNCLFYGNQSAGGVGGSGGNGYLTTVNAGNGGAGGYSYGADIYSDSGGVFATNCTFYSSSAAGGRGGNGGTNGPTTYGYRWGGNGGEAYGGAVYSTGNATNVFHNNTLALGAANGGAGGFGLGQSGSSGTGHGGILVADTSAQIKLLNSIVSGSLSGGNAYGTIADGGYNVSSDSTCSFTHPNSLNSTDPMLGSLSNNGGPTGTIPLLSGSPCIGASNTGNSPPLDQRLFYRNGSPDIGSYEFNGSSCIVSIENTGPFATCDGKIGFFTVFRNIATNQITISYSISGSASNGVDYASLSNSIVLSNGMSWRRIYVKGLTNANFNGFKTVTLALTNGTNYAVVSPADGTVYLYKTNVFAEDRIFTRGNGSSRMFLTVVAPVNYQKGIKLSETGGSSSNLFPGIGWTTNYYHYDATNVYAGGANSNRIAFQNPIVAFGSRVGGSSMFVGQSYTFDVYAGDRTNLSSPILISIYARSNFSLTSQSAIIIPSPASTNEWDSFIKSGRTVSVSTNGLTTTVKVIGPLGNWGTGSNTVYQITHTADQTVTDKIFEIDIKGVTYDGFMVTDGTGSSAYSKLYTIEFESTKAWQSQFIQQPHFSGLPMPLNYDGKSTYELTNDAVTITNLVTLNPTNCLSINASPELRRHRLLDEFVASLDNDPVALANYVFNEVELSDAVASDDGRIEGAGIRMNGVKRGAFGVFTEKKGSPVEQCGLLIYLLRQAGIPAVYVFPPENGVGMLDSRLSKMLRMQLNGALDRDGLSRVPKVVPVNYPWVAAYSGTNWVFLFPWIKDTEIVEGLDIYSLLPQDYNNGFKWSRKYLQGDTNLLSLSETDSPRTLFPQFIKKSLLENAPGLSLDDVGVKVHDRKNYRKRLTEFPKPTFVTNSMYTIESLAVLSNAIPAYSNIFDKITVTLTSSTNPTNVLSSGEMRALDLHGRQFIVWYQPTNDSQRIILSLAEFTSEYTNRSTFATANALSMSATNVLLTLSGTNILKVAEDAVRLVIKYDKTKFGPTTTMDEAGYLQYGERVLPDGAGGYTFSKDLKKGDINAICFNLGSVSSDMLRQSAERYWRMQQKLAADPSFKDQLTPEIVQGPLAYLVGMNYFSMMSDFKRQLEQLHKVNSVSLEACCVISLVCEKDGNGEPTAYPPIVLEANVDVLMQKIGYAGNGTIRPDFVEFPEQVFEQFFPVYCVTAAATEHEILNRFFDVNSAASSINLLRGLPSVQGTNTIGAIELTKANYLTQGEITYNGLKLREADSVIWQAVKDAFESGKESDYTLAFMTPGIVTNRVGAYSGAAAAIIGRNYARALIGDNLNGSNETGFDYGSIFGPRPQYTLPAGPGLTELKETVLHSYDVGDFDESHFGYIFKDSTATAVANGATQLPTVIITADKIEYVMPNLPIYQDLFNNRIPFNITDNIRFYQFQTYSPLGTLLKTPGETLKEIVDKGELGATSYKKGSQQLAADPVNILNGEFYLNTADLVVNGPFPLLIGKTYSSSDLSENTLGSGWKPYLIHYLSVEDNGMLLRAAEMDGSVIAYRSNSANLWIPSVADNPSLNNTTDSGKGTAGVFKNQISAVTNSTTGVIEGYVLRGYNGSLRQFSIQAFPLAGVQRERPYLQTWYDQASNYWKFKYGTNLYSPDYGAIQSVYSANGNAVNFRYDIYGRISDVFLKDGRSVKYVYDQSGDLITTVLPDGARYNYEYKHLGMLYSTNSSATNYVAGSMGPGASPDGVSRLGALYQFDVNVTNRINFIDSIPSTNRTETMILVFSSTIPPGAPASYFYTTNNCYITNQITSSSITASATNSTSTHLLVSELKPDGRGLFNIYDAERRVITQQMTVGPDLAAYNVTSFAYSNNYYLTNGLTNRVTGNTYITNAVGGVVKYTYTNSLIRKIEEPLGLTVVQDWFDETETNKAGYFPRSLESITDKRGLVHKFMYDFKGNLTNEIFTGDLLGDGSSVSITNSYAYATNNVLLEAIDPTGRKIVNQYGSQYPYLPTNMVLYVGATAISTNVFAYHNVSETVTNGSLLITNSAFGLLAENISAVGAEQMRSSFSHDGRGFISSSVAYSGTTNPSITNYFFYDYRGNLVEQRNLAGHLIRYDHDAMGRLKAHEIYDASGKALSWEYSYYNENGELVWSDGPRYNPEDYVWRDYDGAGRKIQEIRWRSRAKADGTGVEAETGDNLYSTTFYDYDTFGNLVRVADNRGSYVTNLYDTIGRMIETRQYDSIAGAYVNTNRYGYEPGGLVAAVTNSLGGVTRSFYTSTGKLRRQENPDGTVLEWRYLADGRLQKELLSNGNYWETEYDDVNRKETRRYKQANGTLLATESKEFDRLGKLIKSTDAEGYTSEMFYDGLGRNTFSRGPVTISNVSTQQTASVFYDGYGIAVTNMNSLGEYGVTIRDAAGRVLTNDTYTAAGTLLRRVVTSYSDDHNSVTTTTGTGSSAIVAKAFTDTFGKVVLTQTFANAGADYAINTYDIVGNLVSSQDELGQVTQFTYDGVNRLKSKVLPDGATTTFSYDPAGNTLSRVMPGGLTWSASYDSIGRKTAEQLSKGTNVTRNFAYSYYASNSPYAGKPYTVTDPRGVTQTFFYDDYLRLSLAASSGSLSEQNQVTFYGYDKLGRVLYVTQATTNGSPTTVSRAYDGYGQVYDEQVSISGTNVSHFTQKWDAAGRRRQLAQSGGGAGSEINYAYRADGLMSQVFQGGLTFSYSYLNNGLLDQRITPLNNRFYYDRDGRGRPQTAINSAPGIAPSFEVLGYRANSTMDNYTIYRFGLGAWNETKEFSYNSRGQLTQETLSPYASANSTYQYGFDTNKLGVLVSASLSGAINDDWHATALDSFSRVSAESLSVTNFYLQAKGHASGAGAISLTLDTNSVGVYYDASSTNGLWLADMTVAAGSHTLKASARHPMGTYTNSVTNSFTVLAKSGSVTNVYDAAGNVTLRTLPGGRVQSLVWDAAGRLLRMTDRNGSNDGFNWVAVYDAFGRRLQTAFQAVTNNVTQTNSLLVTASLFDPQVEFLELAASVNGQRTWKVYGPDLNGGYGALQGIGGLEATIRESDGLVTGLVNDAFGNVVASVTGDGVLWSSTRVNGYGPLPGYQPLVFTTNTSLAEATVWRSRRIDPTGLYWIGARYYAPDSGRFVSSDPLGHLASDDLYSYAGGDPVNGVDADGRQSYAVYPPQIGWDPKVREMVFSAGYQAGFEEGSRKAAIVGLELGAATIATVYSEGAAYPWLARVLSGRSLLMARTMVGAASGDIAFQSTHIALDPKLTYKDYSYKETAFFTAAGGGVSYVGLVGMDFYHSFRTPIKEKLLQTIQSEEFINRALSLGYTEEHLASLASKIESYGEGVKWRFSGGYADQTSLEIGRLSLFGPTKDIEFHELGHMLYEARYPGTFAASENAAQFGLKGFFEAEQAAYAMQYGGNPAVLPFINAVFQRAGVAGTLAGSVGVAYTGNKLFGDQLSGLFEKYYYGVGNAQSGAVESLGKNSK